MTIFDIAAIKISVDILSFLLDIMIIKVSVLSFFFWCIHSRARMGLGVKVITLNFITTINNLLSNKTYNHIFQAKDYIFIILSV